MITTIQKLLIKKNIYNESIESTKVAQKSQLTLNCMNYIQGKCLDEDFITEVESLAKNMNLSKYETVEYLLDRQERTSLSKQKAYFVVVQKNLAAHPGAAVNF